MEEVWIAVLLVLVCFAGSFVQRVAGFGFGIFVMMFLPYLLPSQQEAAAVSGLFSCSTCILNAIYYRRQINWKLLLPMIATALVTIPLAVWFSAAAPAALMKRLLGVALIGLSIYFLFFAARLRFRPTVASGAVVGVISGVLGSLFSTGGPPVVLYLVQATADKVVYFSTIQAFFAISNLYTTVNRAINGIIGTPVLLSFAIGIFGCIAGNLVGGKVFSKLDGEKLKRVVYIGMILSGAAMLL